LRTCLNPTRATCSSSTSPGATAETTEVLAEDGRIVIEGRREKEVPDGFRYVREDRPLFLDAELPLPSDADGSGADAEMDRGFSK